jgi:hypothetical protein
VFPFSGRLCIEVLEDILSEEFPSMSLYVSYHLADTIRYSLDLAQSKTPDALISLDERSMSIDN